MRYVYAIIAAAALIGAFLANHTFVTVQVNRIASQARAQLGLAPDAPADFGVELPRHLIYAIQIDHVFVRFWFVLCPLIIIISFAIAFATERIRSK
jgi:hypothetical protein